MPPHLHTPISSQRQQQARHAPVAFIFTAVNPCALRRCAAASSPAKSSPPIHPYTRTRSRTAPPSSACTGTPSDFPLMSHSAMSSPESALCDRGPCSLNQPGTYRRRGDGATHHQHGPAGVEAAAHGGLPDVLDAVRSRANEALQVDERALDGLGVPLERCLAPADGAVGGFDAHEEPPGRHAEGLPGPCDRPLSIAGMHRRMGSAD